MSWTREEIGKLLEPTRIVKSTSQIITRMYIKYAKKNPGFRMNMILNISSTPKKYIIKRAGHWRSCKKDSQEGDLQQLFTMCPGEQKQNSETTIDKKCKIIDKEMILLN